MRINHDYEGAAAGVAFRLRQLAAELEAGSANHIASSLAGWWGDTTQGVMELLQLAEVVRTTAFLDSQVLTPPSDREQS
jgi:hypothetical protein